jgi:hypothetical protein
LLRDLPCADLRIYLDVEVRRVACRIWGAVKRERLEWLADNPFYTKRFAFFVGRRCRISTIKDVAEELHLLGPAGSRVEIAGSVSGGAGVERRVCRSWAKKRSTSPSPVGTSRFGRIPPASMSARSLTLIGMRTGDRHAVTQ